MATILEHVYPVRRPVSAGQILVELNLARQDMSTVLFEISYGENERYYLFLYEGQLFELYHADRATLTLLDNISIANFFSGKGQADLRVMPLLPRAFRPLRVLLHHQQEAEQRPAYTDRVMPLLAEIQSVQTPTLVNIRWSSAEAFAFLPGCGQPARELIFLAPDQPQQMGLPMMARWPEQECVLYTYPFQPESDPWKQMTLSIGFGLIFEQLADRYNDLAGRALVNRLEQDLNAVARSQALSIIFAEKAVEDAHLFISSSDAAMAYRSFYKVISQQIGTVVGPKLVQDAVSSALDKVSPALADMLTQKRVLQPGA